MTRESKPKQRSLPQLGAGLITGAADDDPSGIATYSAAGAAFGFAHVWTALLTLPLMAVVQFICGKIGMVTGRGLAAALRLRYSRKVLFPLVLALVVANTINTGTNIAAVAAGINLFLPLPIAAMVLPIAVIIVALQTWGSYRILVKVLKWLSLVLFAYIGAALLAKPDWSELLRDTLIPRVQYDAQYLTVLVAILGTTISPYLFFWQASEEVEEEVKVGRKKLAQRAGATREELRTLRNDTLIGMTFSNLVFYFVIVAAGATLHVSGKTEILSAADAAGALRPIAGEGAAALFAIGLIGAGLLAVPVLTGSAAYAVSEMFDWKVGLDTKPRRAKQFYAVIALSTLAGVLLDFLSVNVMTALFWSAVINGIVAPPLLVIIMLIANDRRVMGEHVNGWITNTVGWIATGVMFAAVVGMALTWWA